MSDRPKRRYASKAEIVRAVEAWRTAGKEPAGIELGPDGTIRLTPAVITQPGSAYAEWKAQRG